MVLLAVQSVAQERRIYSREELDALINPALTNVARGAIVAERETCNMGEVADNERVNALFSLRNTTDEVILITSIHSSCSCLKVATPISRIEVGESVTLRMEFNPAGRNGAFSIPIHIYTMLDPAHPALRLVVEGSVVATDEWSHLPHRMGALRMSRKSVTFDQNTRTERIAVVNVGDEPLTISARQTTDGIMLRTEPEILMPNEEGDIVITYSPSVAPTQEIETAIIVDGCGMARPTERMIKITIKQ